MSQADIIRNGLIDKLLAISDKEYLLALSRLVESSSVNNEKIKFTPEQLLMLQMSENDISNGRVITQEELDKSDLKWLNEQ
jgi:hypothetical protein